jgi:hypothetical protein
MERADHARLAAEQVNDEAEWLDLASLSHRTSFPKQADAQSSHVARARRVSSLEISGPSPWLR